MNRKNRTIIFNGNEKNKKKSEKNFLSIHTVFIPRENILFIEDWIRYHLYLGFDHLYLYNNHGSVGDGRPVKKNVRYGINKYNFNYKEATSHLSDDEVLNKLESIISKYKDSITHVRWAPLNEKGEICYGHYDAFRDWVERFKDQTEWISFIDIDEFIYSEQNINIKKFLKDSYKDDVREIVMLNRRFKSRWTGTSIFDIKDCEKHIGKNRSAKNIVVADSIKRFVGAHKIRIKKGKKNNS